MYKMVNGIKIEMTAEEVSAKLANDREHINKIEAEKIPNLKKSLIQPRLDYLISKGLKKRI